MSACRYRSDRPGGLAWLRLGEHSLPGRIRVTETKRLSSLCSFCCAAPIVLVLVVVLVLDPFAVGKCIRWFPSFVCLFSAQTPANQRRSMIEDENDDEDED